MAYTITSESYGPRKPFITATATSTDDLADLGTDFAEGSTCVISSTTYKLDKVKGWIVPSQGGGGVLIVNAVADFPDPQSTPVVTVDKTSEEVYTAAQSGHVEAHVTGFRDGVARILPLHSFSIEEGNTYDLVFVSIDTSGIVSQLEMYGDENYLDVHPLNID